MPNFPVPKMILSLLGEHDSRLCFTLYCGTHEKISLEKPTKEDHNSMVL